MSKTIFSEKDLCNIPRCPKCHKRMLLVQTNTTKKYYVCLNESCKNYFKSYYVNQGKLFAYEFKDINLKMKVGISK